MRSYKYFPTNTTIQYNGDYSGDAVITHNGDRLIVPIPALLGFAAGYLRTKQAQRLEEATDEEIIEAHGGQILSSDSAPQFDPDLPPEHPTNKIAAEAHGLQYDPAGECYRDADGCQIRDKFGQPY